MAANVEDIRNELIDSIGEKAERFGFPRIAGQIEGLLYFSNRSMSLDEMAERLEVSKASVSTNIRLLENWKVVRRVYQRGERKNFYEIKGTIWEIETEIASTIVKVEMERFRTLISQSTDDLRTLQSKTKAGKDDISYLNNRLLEIREYMDACEHVLNLLLKKGKITPAVIKKIRIN